MGYKINEILAATEEASKIREERVASFQNKKWDGFNIVVEIRPKYYHSSSGINGIQAPSF